MNQAADPHDVLPPIEPRLRVPNRWRRDLAPSDAVQWLWQGWSDFLTNPGPSLAYGLLIFAISVVIVGGLFLSGADYILFPALAAFMVVGPLLAIGLYEKSRRIADGEQVSLANMIFIHPSAGAQVGFLGVLLCLLALLWMRSAIIVYALFFGLRPFPGLDNIAPMLFGTPVGWAMLLVGTGVGALFAAFAFAISVFSIPLLLDKRLDALTAMGVSVALTANNLPVMLTWGAIVLGLFMISLLTGLLGLIVVFPVLGHATWRAYCMMEP